MWERNLHLLNRARSVVSVLRNRAREVVSYRSTSSRGVLGNLSDEAESHKEHRYRRFSIAIEGE